MSNLLGKTALVTGSTSGIGKKIADYLAQKGVNIILNGFGDLKEIEAYRIFLEETYKVKVLYNPADLTDVQQIESLFKEVSSLTDGIDILVNNAGMQYVSPIEAFPSEKWDLIIALNLTAAFHTTRLSIPFMKQQKWGRIINIASAHALVASPFKSAYVAAKHGIAGLTKTVSLEAAPFGITCNAICPGYVWTPLVEGQVRDTAKSRGITEDEVKKNVLLAAQPTKEFTTTDQVAELVLTLCSSGCQNMTGSLIPLDGGWTAQ